MCAGPPPPNCHEGRLSLFTCPIMPLCLSPNSVKQRLTLLQLTTQLYTHGYKKDKPFTYSQASKKSQGSALVWVNTQLNMFLNPRLFRAWLFTLSVLIPCHLCGGAELMELTRSLPCRHPQESPVRKGAGGDSLQPYKISQDS